MTIDNRYRILQLVRVFFLGFASGLPLALCLGTLTTWLADYDIKKSAIGFFALVSSPYTLKFLWSHLVDHLPLPLLSRLFGQRRSWMLLCQVGLIICFFLMSQLDPRYALWNMAMVAFCISALSATQDIAIDAMRIEMLEKNQQGMGAASLVTGYRLAMLVSGAGAIFLAHYFSWEIAYLAMMPCMSIGILTVLLSAEPKVEKADSAPISNITYYAIPFVIALALDVLLWIFRGEGWLGGEYKYIIWPLLLTVNFVGLGGLIGLVTGKSFSTTTIAPFRAFLLDHHLLGAVLILSFVILFKFGDAFAGFMTGPFVLELGFSKAEYASYVKSLGLFFTIVGGFVGGFLITRLGMLKSLLLCGIIQMLSNLLFVWLAYAGQVPWILAVVIAGENLAGGMGTAAFVGYISSLCNLSFTATQYALLSSFAAYGRTFLTAGSGIAVEAFGWANFFWLSAALAIPGILMIFVLQWYQKQHQK